MKHPLNPAGAFAERRIGLCLLLAVLTLAIPVSALAQTNHSVTPLIGQSPAILPATNAVLPPAFMEFIGRHVSGYEPIYFLLGTYPGAEFQLSLKYRLFDLERKWNPLAHAYIAYTQTSFWDLFSSDPSFYDTSYKPSGFLYYPDIFESSRFQLGLQGGAEHESNGKGGTGERSLNTVYLQPAARFELPAHLQLTLQPRAWVYFNLGSNNPDMAEYRGYADLLTTLTWTSPGGWEKIQLATKFRIGDEGSHTGLQFDLRFNLPPVLHFNPIFQLQYFTGYGQTLRQYNQHSSAFRAGICIWY